MSPPFGFKILMDKIVMIEDQCSDDGDKKARNKKKLTDAESMSQDPFVRKKMDIQEKIAETREVRLACTVMRACCSTAAERPSSLCREGLNCLWYSINAAHHGTRRFAE
jgi:hypothetical protein